MELTCVCVFGKLNVGGIPFATLTSLYKKQFSLHCQLVFESIFETQIFSNCTGTISFTIMSYFCTDYTSLICIMYLKW